MGKQVYQDLAQAPGISNESVRKFWMVVDADNQTLCTGLFLVRTHRVFNNPGLLKNNESIRSLLVQKSTQRFI
jgi:hypothetical protein